MSTFSKRGLSIVRTPGLRKTCWACPQGRQLSDDQARAAANRAYGTVQAKPRHLLSISDLTPAELARLVLNASALKRRIKSASRREEQGSGLKGSTVAMLFSKRSTRTRVSTEGAVVRLGGHPMFLGKDDVQLGVNESLRDTAIVLSSMTSAIVARVAAHTEVERLAQYSSVPIINALSDLYHPLQIVADLLTIYEERQARLGPAAWQQPDQLGLAGLKIAWVGDANNVLFDMAIAAAKLGITMAVATPKGYEVPDHIRREILAAVPESRNGGSANSALLECTSPVEALHDADIIVTDTWISMGQEGEKSARVNAFRGFQLTSQLIEAGRPKKDWRFMHCLPRHAEEVSDDVFYGPKSLVFPEAENRLYAAMAVLDAFVVHEGRIGPS